MLSLASSFSLLMQVVTLVHQSFKSWANPREMALCFCHFGWNKVIIIPSWMESAIMDQLSLTDLSSGPDAR